MTAKKSNMNANALGCGNMNNKAGITYKGVPFAQKWKMNRGRNTVLAGLCKERIPTMKTSISMDQAGRVKRHLSNMLMMEKRKRKRVEASVQGKIRLVVGNNNTPNKTQYICLGTISGLERDTPTTSFYFLSRGIYPHNQVGWLGLGSIAWYSPHAMLRARTVTNKWAGT